MWTVSSILFNGVSGVGIPNANVVELWPNGALVLGALAFFPPEFRVRQSWCSLVGAEGHFLFVSEEVWLERMPLEAFWMQDDGMGSERVDIVCWALPKTIPSYLGSFTFCRRSVMPEAPLSIIARASGRQYLVYRSLYRGFPQPHIRTCHRSIEENPLAAKWRNVNIFGKNEENVKTDLLIIIRKKLLRNWDASIWDKMNTLEVNANCNTRTWRGDFR